MPYRIPDDTPVMIAKSEIEGLANALDKTEQKLAQAETDRDFYIREAANLQQERDTRIAELGFEKEALIRQIAGLNAEIERLKIPLPPLTADRVTRTSLPRVIGFTIEKGNTAPNGTLYNQVRAAMAWGARMGFAYWRGFFNPQEIMEHLKDKPVYGNLIVHGRSLGLRFIADTIDTILETAISDTALKAYFDGLERLGCEGVYINDADRYPLETLRVWALRLHGTIEKPGVAPNMPIFVSLRGSADLAPYKGLVSHVEVQTFGTPSELNTFLALDDKYPFPVIMCLDARKPLTAAELKARAVNIARNPPHSLFYYADLAVDYASMPEEKNAAIRELVARVKARAS